MRSIQAVEIYNIEVRKKIRSVKSICPKIVDFRHLSVAGQDV